MTCWCEKAVPLTPLQAEECCCWGCGCDNCTPKDWCNCNIISDSDCLRVDTSECGTVHLSVECPKRVVAWDNVRVDETPDEYIVNAKVWDEKVAVKKWCEPDYLANLISWENGISVKENWCKLVISWWWGWWWGGTEKRLIVHNESSYIATTVQETDTSHILNIADAKEEDWPQYAKLVIAEWRDFIVSNLATWATPSMLITGWDKNTQWDVVYKKWCTVDWYKIKINKKWLYHVWFSGTCEIGAWVHAFRCQMYSSPNESMSENHTIIEARYSAPVWTEPWEMGFSPEIDWEMFKIDYPQWALECDVEDIQWKSASLWAFVSRFAVSGNTIVELNKWDWVCMWCKVSTQVDYHWDVLWKITDKTGHIAFLCKNSHRSWGKDIWPEPGLSFYVDLVHPLN